MINVILPRCLAEEAPFGTCFTSLPGCQLTSATNLTLLSGDGESSETSFTLLPGDGESSETSFTLLPGDRAPSITGSVRVTDAFRFLFPWAQ